MLPPRVGPTAGAGHGLAGLALGATGGARRAKAAQLGLAAPAAWFVGEWLLQDKAPGMYSVSVAAEIALAMVEAEARRSEAVSMHTARS